MGDLADQQIARLLQAWGAVKKAITVRNTIAEEGANAKGLGEPIGQMPRVLVSFVIEPCKVRLLCLGSTYLLVSGSLLPCILTCVILLYVAGPARDFCWERRLDPCAYVDASCQGFLLGATFGSL